MKFKALILALGSFCACSSLESSGVPAFGEPNFGTMDITLLSWNVFQVFTAGNDATCRATETGQALADPTLAADIVGLQETFNDLTSAQTDALAVGAAGAYPHMIIGRPNLAENGPADRLEDGGLSLLGGPRTTFGPEIARGFTPCEGSDCLANKGMLYVPVQLDAPGARLTLNVIATHLNAGNSPITRAAQLAEIRDFIATYVCQSNIRKTWPTVLLGDFNTEHFGSVAATLPGSTNALYDAMVLTLSTACTGPVIDVYTAAHGSWDENDINAGTKNCDNQLLAAASCVPSAYLSRRIDYIFILPPAASTSLPTPPTITVTSAAVLPMPNTTCTDVAFLSDHRAISAAINVAYSP